jgi:CDP-diacylglycerol--glycerol-3-phosphate 3-phosphatidyltransferase
VTLPTQLSILRILLTFVIMVLLYRGGPGLTLAAALLFVFASFTDWLDGYLARRFNMKSDFGALLDPIADKVLVLGTFLAFVQLGIVPAWMVLVIALREFVITGVRMVAASRRVVLPAAKEGKHKTVSQMGTLVVLFAALVAYRYGLWSPGIGWAVWLDVGIGLCLWATVLLTLYSGFMFFWQHRSVLRDVVSP